MRDSAVRAAAGNRFFAACNETPSCAGPLLGADVNMGRPGYITRFDFQTALLSLVSSVALFALSSLVVSFLAFSVVPQRYFYQRMLVREVGGPVPTPVP